MAVEVKLGIVQKVLVTDVSESGKFFVQLDTPEAYQLPELSEAICRDVETNPSLIAPDVGAKCYAFSPTDQMWYRAVITNVQDSEITVYYVDYGNLETVTDVSGPSPAGREDRFSSPYQAVCCTLSDFVPSGGKWTAGNVATLQELLTSQEFTAMFQSKNLSENHPSLPSLPCYNLTLFRSDSTKESIAQELVKCGLGQYSICADSLVVASAVNVFTCFIDSLGSFWVQLSDKFVSLQAIMEEINHSKVIGNLTPLPPFALFPGVACCCQFTGDGMFYRAKVTKVGSGEVEVHYVDYGNCEVVTADAVLGIPPHLTVAPAFAVQCCLDGVKPVEQGRRAWSAEACEKFAELSDGRELKAVVASIRSSEVFSVELQDCSSGSQIREVLINSGVAKPTEAASHAPESIVPKSIVPEPIVPKPTVPESTPELQYLSLDVGQQYKVLITCVESPSVVWCQRTEYTPDLDRIMTKLSKAGPHLPRLARPSVDQVCCVQYVEDQSWCRGVIQSVDSAAGKAEVLFVDFGNTERIALSDLRHLDSELLSVPAQAISFSMNEIVPQGGEGWAPDATVKFQELVLERELICRVVGLDQDGYPSAQLLDPQRENRDIGIEFARLGYAKAPLSLQKKLPREEGRTPFKSYSQQSTTRNSSSESSQKSSPFHSQKSSPYHSERSTPYQSRNPRGDGSREQESRDASSAPTHSQVKYSYSNLKIGNAQSYYVTVCHVNNLEEFYCQLLSSAAELQTLMSEIENHCLSSEAAPVTSPQSGRPVIAQFSADEGWYRALITATPSQDECLVLFVDYGNSESVPLSKIREIPPRFFRLSSQAFRCALYGSPHDLTPSQEAIDAFTELTLEQNLHCFVKAMPKGKDLCVVELSTNDKVKVLQKLTKAGHIPSPMLPSEVSPLHEYSQRRDYPQSPRQQDYSRTSRKQDYSQHPQRREFSHSPHQREFSHSPQRRDFSQSPRQQGSSQPPWQQSSPKTRDAPFKQDAPSSSKRRETAQSVKKSLPLPQLPTNTPLDAYVSYAESPARFYIQLVENYTSVEQLSTILNKDSSKYQSSEGVRPDVGTFCVAQFSEDKLWYRARITAIHGSEVEVCFIDFGNSERVQVSKLRPLQTQCEKIPCAAVPCILDGLAPDIAKSPEVMQKFSKLANDCKLVVEFLKPLTSYDDLVPARLLDTSQPGVDLNIGDSLRSIPTSQRHTGTRAQPVQSGIEIPEKQPPVLNSPLDCNVVFVKNPGEFYCQLNSESKEMVTLMDSMYEFYAEKDKGSTITKPSVGSFCVALFSDMSWYRGKFTQVATDSASIFYIDYGNTEDVPMSDVKTLDPQFCVLPAQALKCSLDGVAPLGGTWSPKCIAKFQEAVLEQDVQVTFLRGAVSGCGFDVQLEFKGQVIAQKLIEAGLAKEKDQGSILSFTVQQGETHRVIVTAVTSPQEFYSLIVDKEGRLDTLMDQISEYCSSLPPSPASAAECSWKTGNFVLAQFTVDQGWYRAIITKILQGGINAEVRYVDYGNTETLPVSELRCLPPEFGVLPSQAVRCCLEGAQYYTYSSERLSAFNTLLLDKEFQMKCVAVTASHCAVDLKRVEDNSDLMNYAIQQKIVEPRSVDNTLLPSPNSLQTPEGASAGRSAIEIVTQFPEMDLDSFYDVTVSHVESPSLFYCHFSLYMQEHLTMLMSQLQEVCTTDHKKPSEMKYSKGDFVAVQYSGDDLWYRAKVCDVSADEVLVCFIDYGNEEAASHSRIQYLDPEFAKLPAQAVPCSLAEVLPKEGVDWSDESVEKFSELVLDKPFVAQVKSASMSTKKFKFGDNQTVGVSLIEEECPVSEELVRLGYARLASTVPPETELAEERTELAEEKAELAEKRSALLQSPGQSLEENVLSISVGIKQEVFVTNVESPSCFWLQLASSEEDMNTLAANLEVVYGSGNPPTLSNPAVGMHCCAKFSVDKNWYRGIVRSVTPNGMDIQFIDYGNSEVVGPSDVKMLKPEFLDLPVQSVKCKLINCRPRDHSEWTDEDRASFFPLVLDKLLVAEFVRMSPGGKSWEVRLSEDGADVSTQFIESGAAAADEGSEARKELKITDLKLKENETYSVYIPVTASPTEFYVQLSSECDKLESLMALVTDYYNGNQPSALLEVGRYCVAQYSGNNAWYRAKIVQIESEESVTVHFVDYGNCESIASNQILALKEEFTLLPAQAACCSVTHDLTQQFSDDKLEEFFSLDFEQEFQIRVSGEQNGRYIVQLMGQDATQISDTLLSPSNTTQHRVQHTFTPLSFTPGSSVDVYVSHINSPTSFYCQPLELTGELETMMTKLSSTMKQSPPEQIQDATAGQVCLARFSADNEWYRAIVSNVTKDGKILVTFVDYGNSEMTTVDHLAVLPDAFLSTHLQAVHCSVFENMDAESEWPPEKVEEFQNQIPESDHITLTVTGVSDWNQAFVEIVTNGEPVNFADLLEEHVERSADVASAAQDPATFRPIPADDPLTNQFANISIQDTTAVSTLAVKGSRTPSTEVETESENGAEGEPLIRAPFKLSLAVREEFEATMVHVQSPSLLFIQRADCQAELKALSEEIEQYCAGFAGKPFQEVFRRGDFVLARYSFDELWYRAEVLEVTSESSAKVSFIDFGNTETISFESMTMCPENFLELPVQAIPCSLAQVPHRDSWPPNYKELIDTLVEGRVLKVGVVIPASQGMRSTVTLSDLESGVNIAQPVLDQLQDECEEGVIDEVLLEVPKEDIKGEEIAAAQKIVLPERKFDVGFSYEVYLASCTSPHSFVCQLACEEDALDSVTTQLVQLYTSDSDLHALVSAPVEGDVVCGQFTEDNQWYRARVLSAEGGECEVLYVDFGNTETVPTARLRALTPSLSSQPPLAFECFLSGVESPTGDGQFDPLASEKMLEVVGEASATLEIHSVDTSGHLGVFLTTSHGVDVSATLIEAGLATLLVPTPVATPSTATIPSSQSTIDQTPKADDGGTPLIIDKEISVPSTLDEPDDSEEPLPTSQDLFQECDSSFPEPSSSTQEATEAVCAVSYPRHSLQPGDRLKVVVTAVSSLDEFTCQLSGETAGLQKLSSDIAAREYTVGSEQLALKDPYPGLPVCACFTKDNKWYRAAIISVSKLPGSVTVRYIDYGSSEELVLQRVKHLEQCFADAPPLLAITCSLLVLSEQDLNPNIPKETEPWELLWPMSCVSHFSQLVLKKDLNLEVVNTQEDGTFVVKLMDSLDGTDIRETVVAKLREPKPLQLVEEEEEEEEGEETLNGTFHDALDTEDSEIDRSKLQQLSVEEEGEKGGAGSVSKQEDLESEEDEWTDAREGESSHRASEDASDYQEVREEEEEGEVREEEGEAEVEEGEVVEEGEAVEEEVEEGEVVEEEGEVVEEEGEVVEEEGASKEPLSDVEQQAVEPTKQLDQEWIVLQTQNIPTMLLEIPSESQGEPVQEISEGGEDVNEASTVLQQGQVLEQPVGSGQSDVTPLDTAVSAAMPVDRPEIEREGGELEQAGGWDEGGGGTLSGTATTSLDSPPVEGGQREEECRERERQPLGVEQEDESTSLETPVTTENYSDSTAIEDGTSLETPMTTDSSQAVEGGDSSSLETPMTAENPPDSTAIEGSTSLETPMTADNSQAVEGEGDSSSLETPVTAENPPDSTAVEVSTSLETPVTADSSQAVEGEGDSSSLETLVTTEHPPDSTAVEVSTSLETPVTADSSQAVEGEGDSSSLETPVTAENPPDSTAVEVSTSLETSMIADSSQAVERGGDSSSLETPVTAENPPDSTAVEVSTTLETSMIADSSQAVEGGDSSSLETPVAADRPAVETENADLKQLVNQEGESATSTLGAPLKPPPLGEEEDTNEEEGDGEGVMKQHEEVGVAGSPKAHLITLSPAADTSVPVEQEATGRSTLDPLLVVAGTTDLPASPTDTTDRSQLETDTTDPLATSADTTEPLTTSVDTTEPLTTSVDTTDPSQLETDTTDPLATSADTTDPLATSVDTTVPLATSVETTDPSATSADATDSSQPETDAAGTSPTAEATVPDPDASQITSSVCNGVDEKTSQCMEDSPPTYKDLDLAPGQEIKLIYISGTSPDNFSCQLFDSSKRLLTLMDELKDYITSCGSEPSLLNLKPGEPILAQHSATEEWHRAEVMRLEEKAEVVEVLFVDRGTSENVPLSNVHKLPSRFLELPRQALICGLSGVKPISGDWSIEARQKFQDLATSVDVVIATIVSECEGFVEVRLRSDKCGDFGQELVEAGFAS